MPLKTRLLYLLAAWLPAGVVYIAASFMTRAAWIVPETYVEQLIPFSPSGIWLYLLFYVYIPYTFITAHQGKIRTLSAGFILCACISGIIFIALPGSIRYPVFEVDGISSWCLNFVGLHDTSRNCFPSLHASLITLCTIANCYKEKMTTSAICISLTLLMYHAIVQVRRHVFLDLAAGIILGALTWWLSAVVTRRRGWN